MRRTSILVAALVTAAGTITGGAAAHAQGPTTALRSCATADLAVRVEPGSPGAGQRSATVVLTNTTSRACRVRGHAGLALLGAPGQGVPTDLRWVSPPGPATVRLPPGRSARAPLSWTAVAAGDEDATACEPVAASAAVTPPDQTTAVLLPWPGGRVCWHGLVHEGALVPGSAAF